MSDSLLTYERDEREFKPVIEEDKKTKAVSDAQRISCRRFLLEPLVVVRPAADGHDLLQVLFRLVCAQPELPRSIRGHKEPANKTPTVSSLHSLPCDRATDLRFDVGKLNRTTLRLASQLPGSYSSCGLTGENVWVNPCARRKRENPQTNKQTRDARLSSNVERDRSTSGTR